MNRPCLPLQCVTWLVTAWVLWCASVPSTRAQDLSMPLIPAEARVDASIVPQVGPTLEEGPTLPEPTSAIAPVVPVLPSEIVEAMQARDYPTARKAITARIRSIQEPQDDQDEPEGQGDEAAESSPSEIAYLRYIEGRAHRLEGDLEAARRSLEAAITDDDQGPWTRMIQFELAEVFLQDRDYRAAEALAATLTESLLSDERKDDLARIYRDFALRLADPESSLDQPDLGAAGDLLRRARELAKGESLQAQLLFLLGRTTQRVQEQNARGFFQEYVESYPEGAHILEARYRFGQTVAASTGSPDVYEWLDLVRDLEDDRGVEADTIRRWTLGAIATHSMLRSAPIDRTVRSIRTFLEAYPSSPEAVRAAYLIGIRFTNEGRSEEALSAFRAFLNGEGYEVVEASRAERAELEMATTFQISEILAAQNQFDEAIDAFETYVRRFPDGPRNGDARRRVPDVILAKAADARNREDYEEARRIWRRFLEGYPLDARVSEILFAIGISFVSEEKDTEAIQAWQPLLSRFPGGVEAARATFETARIYEDRGGEGDLELAIETYREINVEPWTSEARKRLQIMQTEQLTVVTPGLVRSDESAALEINSRNIETLTFTAYKLNPETYFRAKGTIQGVEALDIGLVAPDAEWTVDVPGYARYKPIEETYELPDDVVVPGVWVVKVTDQTNLQATTLVIGTDIDAIVKSSRDQGLIFVQNMVERTGVANARILVSDGQRIVHEGRTGNDGVLLIDWDETEVGDSKRLRYLVLNDEHIAGTAVNRPDRVAQGLAPRALLYTDRSAYRPGQIVQLKGVVREVTDGQYDAKAGTDYDLEVFDPSGRRLFERMVTLSDYGTFAEELVLDPTSTLGSYRIRLTRPGLDGVEFNGSFEVQTYQLAKINLTLETDRTVYYYGETIEIEAVARYQYGTPLADRPIEVVLPNGRRLSGFTDDEGKYSFEIDRDQQGQGVGFTATTTIGVMATLPQDSVQTALTLAIAREGYSIALATDRDVYLDDETFTLHSTTLDALGEPVGRDLQIAVLKQVRQGRRTAQRQVSEATLTTDDETGRGQVDLTIDDDEGGSYVLQARGTDRFGNTIVQTRSLTVSGTEDPNRLRILTDRTQYKVGETAEVTLVSRDERDGPALITWEADRILRYRIVPLTPGQNTLTWEVDGPQFPNFTLGATRMSGTRYDETRLDLNVVRDLRVTVATQQDAVGPGDEVTVEVTTTDQLGQPVAAEITLALIDEALLRIYGDSTPQIGPFFYGQERQGSFEESSSNTFVYKPTTVPVAQALVEERERLELIEAEIASRAEVADALERSQSRDLAISDGFARESLSREFDADKPASPSASEEFYEMELGQAQGAARPRSRFSAPNDPSYGMDGAMADELAEVRRGRGGFGGGALLGGQPLGRSPMGGVMLQLQDGESGGYGFGIGLESGRRMRLRAESSPAQTIDYFASTDVAGTGENDKNRVTPRQQYVETAYWNPSVITDSDGKATVTFRAPTALSKYRFLAKGTTGSDTMVGQTTASLSVRKRFFVDLIAPTILTEGDSGRIRAEIHHLDDVDGTIEVTLEAYAGGRQEVYPQTIEVDGAGVERLLFEPFEVPEADVVQLTLKASMGDQADELTIEVPVRPWGIQAFATSSGTEENDRTISVRLPQARGGYRNPELLLTIAPSLQRQVIELAVGPEIYPLPRRVNMVILPVPQPTTITKASRLLAATAALEYLQQINQTESPDAVRLRRYASSLTSTLVAKQNDDGGWPAILGTAERGNGRSLGRTSAQVVWALAEAEGQGLLADRGVLDRGVAFVAGHLNRLSPSQTDDRAEALYALSTRGAAGFEQANSLNRVRTSLSNRALAHLALTFANLGRPELGREVLNVLVPRGVAEPGAGDSTSWEPGAEVESSIGSTVGTTARVALALARLQPDSPALQSAIAWLEAHRFCAGWSPESTRGPAVAALSAYYAEAVTADDRYRLTVQVNGEEVLNREFDAENRGEAVVVPRRFLRPGAENTVRFDIEGRGTFGYSALLTGFTRDFTPYQNRNGRLFYVQDRRYEPAQPVFEGQTLATGFNSVQPPYRTFRNLASQVALGDRVRVTLDAYTTYRRVTQTDRVLVIEEPHPSGTTIVDGSVQSNALYHTVGDGLLTLYYESGQSPGTVTYELVGFEPGNYRALPTRIRDAYDRGSFHLGKPGALRVLPPGEESTDEYRPTPDELLARGQLLFDQGRLLEAAEPLEELFTSYPLKAEVQARAAGMLLDIFIAHYDARKVVRYFEVVKQRAPERIIPFDQIRVVGRAYRDLGEFERAYLIWIATAEASYIEDAQLGQTLQDRGRRLEGVALLLDLWRQYPGLESIRSDAFGLSQLLAQYATQASQDRELRRALIRAEVTRPQLWLQAIRLDRALIAQAPTTPIADEISLAVLGSYLELEDFDRVVDLARQGASLYPESPFLDSFQFSEALGRFNLSQYDRAIEVARTIAEAVYEDENGSGRPSPNKFEALYILGQIYDARRELARAVEYYERVRDRFTDADDAIDALTGKALTLPEVTVVRPPADPDSPAEVAGLRSVGIGPIQDDEGDDDDADTPSGIDPTITLTHRNVGRVGVTVYPVDLQRLYLTRRNLDRIAGIDLAGITPLVKTELDLGDDLRIDEATTEISLPIEEEGAYLVMVRGGALDASGIVLVSPLEIQVLEEPGAGRVRLTVRDVRTDRPASRVQVKVIGSNDLEFRSGVTDLRGVYTAEGLNGVVSAVARRGTDQYAFYRGETPVGQDQSLPARGQQVELEAAPTPNEPALEQNLRMLNNANQLQQIDRLQQRIRDYRKGVEAQKAY